MRSALPQRPTRGPSRTAAALPTRHQLLRHPHSVRPAAAPSAAASMRDRSLDRTDHRAIYLGHGSVDGQNLRAALRRHGGRHSQTKAEEAAGKGGGAARAPAALRSEGDRRSNAEANRGRWVRTAGQCDRNKQSSGGCECERSAGSDGDCICALSAIRARGPSARLPRRFRRSLSHRHSSLCSLFLSLFPFSFSSANSPLCAWTISQQASRAHTTNNDKK